MGDKYTIKDVTRDLSSLVSPALTKLFTVDDEGFWIDHVTKERFVYKLDGNEDGREIVVFQDPMPKGNYYYFNPYAEGFGKSPAVQLYYRTIRIALNLNIRTTLLYMTQAVLEAKIAAAAKQDYAINHAVVRMSSVLADKKSTIHDLVDEKLLDEFETLFDRMKDECLHIPYLTQRMTAKVQCEALSDPKWDEKYGKDIRKKSLLAFKAGLMGVLGISKPEELQQFSVTYNPDDKSSARFSTTMSVFLKVYTRFNDVLADAYSVDGEAKPSHEIDLGELAENIERFPLAYAIAKHMIQPVIPSVSAIDTSPVDTSRLRIGNDNGTRRFAGPEVVDNFGQRSRGVQSLQLGRPTDTGRRFAPQVISTAPVDPFSPSVSSMPGSSILPAGGGGLGMNNQSGGYFGNNYGGFGSGGGLNFNAPSNFSDPNARRSYF